MLRDENMVGREEGVKLRPVDTDLGKLPVKARPAVLGDDQW